jgi:hypothetical protein
MDKSWFKKFKRRAEKLLHRVKKVDTNDFDESQQQYKLVSVYLINYGGKKKKGVRSPPVSGSGLYYVISDKDDGVKLLHPVMLDIYTASKRQFEKGITDVWWPNQAAVKDPNVKNKLGYFCNRFNVAETLLSKLKEHSRREKLTKKIQDVVRAAIADLKEIPIEQVPKYKLPKKVDHLSAWKEAMAKMVYKKNAISDLKKYLNKKDEGAIMSKKDKKKKASSSSAAASSSSAASSSDKESSSAAASSSASDTNDKKSKKEKKGKKSKKEAKPGKADKSKPGEVKAPRGKKTAVAVVLQMLLKKKGKKIPMSDLQAAVQKAKGMKKEFPEKKIQSKVKAMTKWAEKNELKLKASSSGMSLS